MSSMEHIVCVPVHALLAPVPVPRCSVGARVLVTLRDYALWLLCAHGGAIGKSSRRSRRDAMAFDACSWLLFAAVLVNQAGRVNGNLNLSRSIGDLKYKQSDAPPAAQVSG